MDPGGRDRLDVRGSRCFSRSLLSLQALSYAGSRADVHAPALVESQTLREDGSVVKRFGLAWSDASPTNTLKTCPTSEREKQSPAQSPKPPGSISPRLSGVSCRRVPLRVDACPPSHPLGFSEPPVLSGQPAGAPVLTGVGSTEKGGEASARARAWPPPRQLGPVGRVSQGHTRYEVSLRERGQ